MTAGASATLTSNTISLDCVPSKIYVYARIANSARSYAIPDTLCSISNVSVTYNNRSSCLSNLGQYDLFQMSRDNQVNQNWMQFSKYQGSLVAIDVSKNIGVPNNEAAGVRRKTQFSVQCTFRNESLNTYSSVALYVVPVLPGYCQIGQGTASFGVGLLSEEEASMSKTHRYNLAAYNSAMAQNSLFSSVGGSFLSDLGDAAKFVANAAIPAIVGVGVRGLLGAAIGGRRSKSRSKSRSMSVTYKHKAKKSGKKKKKSKRRGGSALDVENMSNTELEQRLRGMGINSDNEEDYLSTEEDESESESD